MKQKFFLLALITVISLLVMGCTPPQSQPAPSQDPQPTQDTPPAEKPKEKQEFAKYQDNDFSLQYPQWQEHNAEDPNNQIMATDNKGCLFQLDKAQGTEEEHRDHALTYAKSLNADIGKEDPLTYSYESKGKTNQVKTKMMECAGDVYFAQLNCEESVFNEDTWTTVTKYMRCTEPQEPEPVPEETPEEEPAPVVETPPEPEESESVEQEELSEEPEQTEEEQSVLSTTFVDSQNPGTTEAEMTHDSLDRTYRLYVPEQVRDPAPLIIALHGGFGNAPQLQNTATLNQFDTLAEEEGFVVVYPDGVKDKEGIGLFIGGGGAHWNVGAGDDTANQENVDDQGFLLAMIDDIDAAVNVDKDRVYITGISNGAGLTVIMGCEHEDKVAAIAPVAVGYYEESAAGCEYDRQLPVLWMSGTADELTPYDPEGVDRFASEFGCNLESTETPLPDVDPDDGTTVVKEEYTSCDENIPFIFYRIEGGGHAWPSGGGVTNTGATFDINPAEHMWEFFKQYSLS